MQRLDCLGDCVEVISIELQVNQAAAICDGEWHFPYAWDISAIAHPDAWAPTREMIVGQIQPDERGAHADVGWDSS